MTELELLDAPVQVVAGKGGVGRSTVATAVALRLARRGHRTLLLEVDGPDATTRLLGRAPAVDTPREVENNLWSCRMTPAGSLREYALLVLRFKTLYRVVFENRLVRYLLRSIPSLAELTMLGKAWWHATQERDRDGRRRFDRVVIDAPATGHALTFLGVARTVARVAPAGAMKDQTEEMARWVEDAVLHVVALPEEMPVNEGLELWAAASERLAMRPGLAIANRVSPASFTERADDLRALAATLPPDLGALLERRLHRAATEQGHVERFFAGAGRPGLRIEEASLSGLALVEHAIAALERLPPAQQKVERDLLPGPGLPKLHLQGPSPLSEVVHRARCVVCVGPGGVGKTSASAAIAIEAARIGRRTVVLTIDPARRLANALGLPEIGNVETAIGPQAFTAAGLEPPSGKLTALMLDIEEAWDDVLERYHPDPEARRTIRENPLYHALSTSLAGSQEYMAMEKLHRLATREDDRPDLIVLDTPPAQHALDFLEAPSRIVEALDNDATRWLLEPRTGAGRLSRRFFDAGSSLFIRTIARFTGIELLEQLAELLSGFSSMFEGFRARARAVKALLSRDDTVFVVVGHPGAPAEVEGFVATLTERDLAIGAVVLNRGTPRFSLDPSAEAVAEASGDLAECVLDAARTAARKSQTEAHVAARLENTLPVRLVPELSGEVSDLASLDALRDRLFSPDVGP